MFAEFIERTLKEIGRTTAWPNLEFVKAAMHKVHAQMDVERLSKPPETNDAAATLDEWQTRILNYEGSGTWKAAWGLDPQARAEAHMKAWREQNDRQAGITEDLRAAGIKPMVYDTAAVGRSTGLGGLTTTELSGLKRTQIPGLVTSELRSIVGTSELRSLGTTDLAALTSTQLATLSADAGAVTTTANMLGSAGNNQ